MKRRKATILRWDDNGRANYDDYILCLKHEENRCAVQSQRNII